MTRYFKHKLLLIAACVISPVAWAQTPPPAIKLHTGGQLVTPDSAWAYYGATSSPAISTAGRPAQIKALARALSRGGAVTGDPFAERVATYVRRNIETEFRFGLGKGARGAVIDQSGTPYDQAQLMVEVLREGGLSASYKIGTITLTAEQFGKWTGLVTGLNEAAQTFNVNAAAACNLLADGGIPATVNGSTNCASLSGNVSSVVMAHIWVIANGKAYDPSYKPKLLRAGIDIAAAMQCGTDASPTCGSGAQTQAMSGALTGTQYTANYIERVNLSALETTLQSRAGYLENEISANVGRDALLEEVIGGGLPDDSYAPAASTSLPYESVSPPTWVATWNGEIPNTFRTTFTVNLMSINGGNGVVLFADEIAGKRLTITTNTPNASWQRTTHIFVDDVAMGSSVVALSGGNLDQPLLRVNYPYAANKSAGGTLNGTYGDDEVTMSAATDARDGSFCVPNGSGGNTCGIGYNNIYTVFLNLGNSGPGQEQHYARLMGDGHGWSFPGTTILSFGFPPHPPASPLFVQSTAAARILAAISKSAITPHHSMGVIFYNWLPGDGQPYMNVSSAVSVANVTNDATTRTAAYKTYASVISALEGSIRQQSQDGFESPSMVSMFKLFNDQQYRFFEVTSSSMATSVLQNSQNYTDVARNWLQTYANGGWTVIFPLNGLLGNYPVPGGGQVYYNITPELIFKPNESSHLISERYKGGGAIPALQPIQTFLQSVDANTYSLKKRDFWSYDLASGLVTLTPPPDLAVGVAGAPGSLEFRRSYSSSGPARQQCQTNWFDSWDCSMLRIGGNSQVGGGWDHNLNRRAAWSTNALEAFGQTFAIRAAGTIARLATLVDINRNSSFQRRMTSIFATYSLGNSFLKNSIVVDFPPQSYSFIRLPSGTFSPPPTSRGASVTVSGTPGLPYVFGSSVLRNYGTTTLVFTGPDGAVTNFTPGEVICVFQNSQQLCPATPNYVAQETVLPNGLKERFNYNTTVATVAGRQIYPLLSVTTSRGNTINVVPTSNARIAVNDGSSRSALIGCAAPSIPGGVGASEGTIAFLDECPSGASFTNPRNGVSKVDYGPSSGSPSWGSPFAGHIIGSWYTPLNTSTPYLRFDYDPMLHIAGVTDIGGKKSELFVASVSDERWRLGELKEPGGAVTTTEFDKFGRALKVTDALGRITTNRYDNAGQLVRAVQPEGNAVEFQYDARGNQTRQCQIPKQRAGSSCNPAAGDLAATTAYVGGPTLLPTQCANRKTCNRPSYVDDARGNRTDYVWNTNNGDPESVTGPADELGVRPQTSYGYATITGTDSVLFEVLTSRTEKIDASTSVMTTYQYDTASNRFALKGSVVDDSGLALRTCYKFDVTGNLISQTQPKALLGSCP